MEFEEVFSFDNMYKSAKKCCKNVRWKTSVQNFEQSLMKNAYTVRKQVLNGTYKSKGFHSFALRERGKVRKIQAVHISERMVQKCLCDNCLVPLFSSSFIHDNGACLPNKGVSFAVKRLKTHLHQYSLKYGSQGYVLLFDVRDFFNSINHAKLLEIAKYKIKDRRLFDLFAYFVNYFEGETGLGLGSQISQISAGLYLGEIDKYLKNVLAVKYYGRYMDDGYIFHHSKEQLKDYLNEIIAGLDKLGLKINPHKTHIVKLSNGFTFLKRKIFLFNNLKIVTKPNKANILRYKRKYKKLGKNNKGKDALDVLTQSFVGYLKKFNYYDRYTKKK